MNKWQTLLFNQYKPKYEARPQTWMPPKSHWRDCNWMPGNYPVTLPCNAPAKYISCNACLRRRGYIRIIGCSPQIQQWGWRFNEYKENQCSKCEYGLDHETWLRVRGVGEKVEPIVQMIDPEAIHPVTWEDIGLVPFSDGDMRFKNKEELNRFVLDIYLKYGIIAGDNNSPTRAISYYLWKNEYEGA